MAQWRGRRQSRPNTWTMPGTRSSWALRGRVPSSRRRTGSWWPATREATPLWPSTRQVRDVVQTSMVTHLFVCSSIHSHIHVHVYTILYTCTVLLLNNISSPLLTSPPLSSPPLPSLPLPSQRPSPSTRPPSCLGAMLWEW